MSRLAKKSCSDSPERACAFREAIPTSRQAFSPRLSHSPRVSLSETLRVSTASGPSLSSSDLVGTVPG
eukprot:742537-Rhodomonas_salina.2